MNMSQKLRYDIIQQTRTREALASVVNFTRHEISQTDSCEEPDGFVLLQQQMELFAQNQSSVIFYFEKYIVRNNNKTKPNTQPKKSEDHHSWLPLVNINVIQKHKMNTKRKTTMCSATNQHVQNCQSFSSQAIRSTESVIIIKFSY